MRRALAIVVLALTLANFAFAAAKRQYQTGKLIDITSDERLRDGTSYRWAIFTVRVADLIYTARGERLRRHSGDAGKGLIVGDEIQVAIDGENLVLVNPDGKEIKMKVIKRARAQ